MLNYPQPLSLYRAVTEQATVAIEAVHSDQLALPTPCTDWTVQQLIDHLVGGTEYLLSAAEGREATQWVDATGADYRRGTAAVMDALMRPGVMDRTCISPLGFEWPISQAVAGTFMDVLIHTWDLARATGQDEGLDPEMVEACIAMFLPEMPERGRAAGIIGPAVEVGADASAQDRLLAAMGRHP
ncbi:TIGR03086 family protein [Mycobacterium sp. JS623]|uniref:TIGR03086 family metal-binding protein n=1 Tax=Mycobacterium sp. JS623 TaxID=212767 RepID=UPI0002A58455|nr:TIGR03086 family metal-binding protein [Mycobacterium sp. JS623]AGB22953.1 TIGR03086 family protein [Mycobacterium sp. JS623]